MKDKLSVVIIDDEPLAIELLATYVEQNSRLVLVKSFTNARKGLQYIQKNEVDLLLLDINMPDINGIEIAEKIQGNCQIIFTTANADCALKGFELDATDYLHKPFSVDRFNLAISKAYRFIQNTSLDKKVVLKVDGKQKIIACNDIYFVEAARKYVAFHTIDEVLICLMSMREAYEMLSEFKFIRIHKSYIINPNFVESYDRFEVRILGRQLPLGETFKKQLFEHFSS